MPVNDMSRIPSFGFESRHIRAKTIEDSFVKKHLDKMKKNSLLAFGVKGLFDRYGSEDAAIAALSKKKYRDMNVSKIVGYIPGLGTLQGLGKFYKAYQDRNAKNFNTKTLLIRAAIETLSLGFVLFPVDKYCDMKRKKKLAQLISE